MKLSQNLYYTFPYVSEIEFLFKQIWGITLAKHGLRHSLIWGLRDANLLTFSPPTELNGLK